MALRGTVMSLRNYREKIGLIDVSRPSIKPKVFSALVWIPSWEGGGGREGVAAYTKMWISGSLRGK